MKLPAEHIFEGRGKLYSTCSSTFLGDFEIGRGGLNILVRLDTSDTYYL